MAYLPNAHSHEPAEAMNDSFDVEDGLGEPLHEELFEKTSHDLVCFEDMTVSACIRFLLLHKTPYVIYMPHFRIWSSMTLLVSYVLTVMMLASAKYVLRLRHTGEEIL